MTYENAPSVSQFKVFANGNHYGQGTYLAIRSVGTFDGKYLYGTGWGRPPANVYYYGNPYPVRLSRIGGSTVGLIAVPTTVQGVYGVNGYGAGQVDSNNREKKHATGWIYWNVHCVRLSTEV